MNNMVAKSYQNSEILCEPYKENGKMYVNVALKTNPCKKVRWYTEAEYKKMYPEIKVTPKIENNGDYLRENNHKLKETLGFGEAPNDFIYIIKGYEDEKHKAYFFNSPCCRRCGWWGFFYNHNAAVLPTDMPEGTELVKLYWNEVGNPDDTLKPRGIIANIVYNHVKTNCEETANNSEYFGVVGERYDFKLTVKKAVPVESYYGKSTIHVFEDENGNEYVWSTGAKVLDIDKSYTMRGTIKEHKEYQNRKQTILTRCMNIKEVA